MDTYSPVDLGSILLRLLWAVCESGQIHHSAETTAYR